MFLAQMNNSKDKKPEHQTEHLTFPPIFHLLLLILSQKSLPTDSEGRHIEFIGPNSFYS